MIIPKEIFDTNTAQTSGGVTGSTKVCVKNTNNFYQLKPSILDNPSKIRQWKANGTDRENFGEVIASKISRAILGIEDFEAAPEVSLVYDENGKKTLVASKYLQGDNVRTLDQFIKENGGNFERHVKFVDGTKVLVGNGEYDISSDKDKILRQDIARGIVASIILGDHDVNPGNFVVVSKKDENNVTKDRVARIDFGHAFNDLLNAPAIFGGQVRDNDNRVLDFLNRKYVAGINSPSKLWRDYPGIVLTQEMIGAFQEFSDDSKKQLIKDGIAEATRDFQGLIVEMKETADEDGQKHVLKSLEAICNNIVAGGFTLDLRQDTESNINNCFAVIEKFALDNHQQMKNVSTLLELQTNIDTMIIQKKNTNEPLIKDEIDKIKSLYNSVKDESKIKSENDIKWIKADATNSAHKGDLLSYIKYRSNTMGLNDSQTHDIISEISKQPEHTIIAADKNTNPAKLTKEVQKRASKIAKNIKSQNREGSLTSSKLQTKNNERHQGNRTSLNK